MPSGREHRSKAISAARTEIFTTRYLPTLGPTPGAAALIAWLLQRGLTVVVATSAQRGEVQALLTICNGQAVVEGHDARRR